MGRLVLTIIRLSVVSVASLVLLGVIMLPATLKPRSDLLVATGTANTANPVSRNKPRFWTPIPEYYSNGIESRPSSNTDDNE